MQQKFYSFNTFGKFHKSMAVCVEIWLIFLGMYQWDDQLQSGREAVINGLSKTPSLLTTFASYSDIVGQSAPMLHRIWFGPFGI